jgi:uncharacterized protein (DUF1778 family)
MGIKDTRKMIGFRATKEQEALIARLTKASGMTQQEWIISTLLAGASDAKATSKTAVILKGAEAKLLIETGNPVWLKGLVRVLLHEGYLWLATKSSNGTQEVLTQVCPYPERLYLAIGSDQPPLAEVKQAISRFEELKGLEFIEKVKFCGCSFLDDAGYFSKHGYEKLKDKALAAIDLYKANLVGASSDLKVVNEEIAIEAILVAPSPVIEAVVTEPKPVAKEPIVSVKPIKVAPTEEPTKDKLNRAELLALMGWTTEAPGYHKACIDSRVKGYAEFKGDRWVRSGNNWNKLTTEQLALNLTPPPIIKAR